MAAPVTPSRPNNQLSQLPSMTPTKERQEVWDQACETASPQFQQETREIVEAIDTVITDPHVSAAARQGAAHIFHCSLVNSAIAAEINPDIFTSTGDDLGGPVAHLAPYAANFVDDRAGQTWFQPGQVTEIMRGGDVAAALALQQTQQNDTSVSEWEKALTKDGLTQGDGLTRENPLFVGGRDYKEEPALVEVTIDVDDNITVERVFGIQKNLYIALMSIVWEARKDRKATFMRLHPWAALMWVNIFVGEALGIKAIYKMNSILSSFVKPTQHGINSQDADQARQLALTPTLSQPEREFFACMERSIHSELQSTNAYKKFSSNYDVCSVIVKFSAMQFQLDQYPKHTPQGYLARSIDIPAAQGVSNRDRLVKACAFRMHWPVTKFNDFLERHNPIGQLTIKFTGGWLMVTTDNTVSTIKKNGKSAILAIIDAVDRIFPELKQITREIHDTLCIPLLSNDRKVQMTVAGKLMSTRKDGSAMMTRVRELPRQTTSRDAPGTS